MKLKDEFITYETDGEQIMVAAGTDSFSGASYASVIA